MRTKR
jgi:hypothetical protein